MRRPRADRAGPTYKAGATGFFRSRAASYLFALAAWKCLDPVLRPLTSLFVFLNAPTAVSRDGKESHTAAAAAPDNNCVPTSPADTGRPPDFSRSEPEEDGVRLLSHRGQRCRIFLREQTITPSASIIAIVVVIVIVVAVQPNPTPAPVAESCARGGCSGGADLGGAFQGEAIGVGAAADGL